MPVLLRKQYDTPVISIEDEIHRRLQRGETDSFIYVVPTKRKLRDLQRDFLKEVPGGIAPAFFLFTLETLASRLYSILLPPKRFIAGPAQAVLMNEAIHSVERSLQYFRLHGNVRRLPKGTLQKIIDVINYLKEKGIYPATLYGEVEVADASEKSKLRDILAIYEAYEKLLGETFIDAAGFFKILNAQWDSASAPALFSFHFSKVNALFISGFDEFSDPELTMLHNLSNIETLGTVISFDYHLDNDELFGHLKENYQKYIQMGFEKIRIPSSSDKTFERHIIQNLFRYDSCASLLSFTETVTVVGAADRHEEVETVAKIIKSMVKEKPDRDLSKVCVAMFQPQTYTNYIRETFWRYGIPANITDRYALDRSPLVVSILSLLAVQQHNYRLNDIMRALSSSYFDFANDGETINACNLYDVATKLKIFGGYKTWTSRIDQRLHLIADDLSMVSDEEEESQLRREELQLKKAHKDLLRLYNMLSRFDKTMTPHEFKERLLSLLDELGVKRCILGIQSLNVELDHLERDTRAYQKFINFLDEFFSILTLEMKDAVRERMAFYFERLRTAISQVRYNIRQKYDSGVLVTSFEETRGLDFDVMMIIGLVDGEFPPVYFPEIFFSTARRERKERYHLTEHRYLFYQALTNFTEHVYLTFPKKDGESELVPSSFLDALIKIVQVKDWRDGVPSILQEAIYSEDELFQRIGKYLGENNTANLESLVNQLPHLKAELYETLDHMAHSIAVERSRTSNGTMPEYDGVISKQLSSEARAALERFRQYVYSVTQLESYGRCPFQYFADRVLRLNVVGEMEEGLSPIERGSFLHELLFEFYISRRERRLPPLSSATEQQFDTAINELLALAHRMIDTVNIPDIFWEADKELIFGSAQRKGVLQEFLEHERQRELDVTPSYFEVAFGARIGSRKRTDPLLYQKAAISANDVHLRGKVDRVEIGKNTFTIIDYKTGATVAKRKDIELGISLQLPLYLYAVERIIAEQLGRDLKGVAGIYYKLKSPVTEDLGIGSEEHFGSAFNVGKRSKQITANDEELKTVIDQSIRYVNEYVDKISKGEFPVTPKVPEKTCTYCDFQTVCRIKSKIPQSS
jgi:ATP-dependent helicase/nuclease subunit B